MLISNLSKKLQKRMQQNLPTKKLQKFVVFYFSYCVQKFLSYKCFGWTFELFVNGFELGIEFWVYDTHINFLPKKFLTLSLFANFKYNADERTQKNEKCI